MTIKLQKFLSSVCVPDPDLITANRDQIPIGRISQLVAIRTLKRRILQLNNLTKFGTYGIRTQQLDTDQISQK